MFSPSLLSMILHSIGDVFSNVRGQLVQEKTGDIAADLERLVRQLEDSPLPMPSVPVIGHAASLDGIRSFVDYSERSYAPGSLRVWGRVPINKLVERLRDTHSLSSNQEYLDLGTPLVTVQRVEADVGKCRPYLGGTPAQPPLLRLALIDLGKRAIGETPDDFGGRVVHLWPQDVVFATHAAKVFETMLARLSDYSPLVQELELIVGLVAAPDNPIGRHCFKHANTVELQSTLRELAKRVGVGGPPLVTNLSMGTHVGPHQGNSPLEQSIDLDLPFVGDRILVCAAGNDGMAGIAARRTLDANVSEHLRLRTDSRGCSELLVEFWWEEGHSSSVTVSVEIRDVAKRLRGSRMTIDPSRSGVVNVMQSTGAPFASVTCESLYHAQCLGIAHCIAFAMSAKAASDLADLTIDFEIAGTRSPLDLNAWVVLPTDQSCSFVGGGVDASICVPATLPNALAVAGVTRRGQPWRDSSRGAPGLPGAPALAHKVEYVSDPAEKGTSYAAPRTAADVVERIRYAGVSAAAPFQLQSYATPAALTQDVVARHVSKGCSAWDPRTGHGSIDSGT